MYTMIIIDDEAVIRNGLNKFVDWNELTIEVLELFEDGKDAIEYLKSNDVDIVLTDIKMNEITGLDVAKFIYETKPDTRTVILSGYKEFEYAQKAIEYKVEHYLLKPTNFPKLVEVFRDLVTSMDAERQEDETLPLLRNQFISDLIMGTIQNVPTIRRRGELLGFGDEMSRPCAILEYRINDMDAFLSDKWSYGRERLNIALRNFFSSGEYRVACRSIFTDAQSFYVFIHTKGPSEEAFKDMVNQELMKIIINAKQYLGFDLVVESLFFYENFLSVSREFEYVGKVAEEADGLTGIKVDVSQYKRIATRYKLFFSKLNEGNEEEVETLTQALFSQLSPNDLPFVKKVAVDLFASLSNRFSHIDMDVVTMTSGALNYSVILDSKDMDTVVEVTGQWLSAMVKYINAQSDDSSDKVIAKAIEYIDTHYSEDISLEDVAGHVYLNSVYFCRFFKQKTTENFTDYLTKVRMERAAELIKEGRYKTYEISEKVGYRNSKYFSRVFRRYTGLTPSDYGRRLSGE